MQHSRNTLDEEIRTQSVMALNRHLAAVIDLHGQLKQAHWNVRGPGFIGVHLLFDQVAAAALADADAMAERAGALGGNARGTVKTAAADSFLIPYPHEIAGVQQHCFAVCGALAAFGQSVRDAAAAATAYGDADTADLFTSISRKADQNLWMVGSNLAHG
jgi:starvation-inducible DNA-binding protein